MFNVHAPFNTLGYGVHGSSWVVSMFNKGIKFGMKPIGMVNGISPDFQNVLFASRVIDFDAPTVVLWHASDIAKYRGKPLIGYTVFETTKFTPFELLELASLDAIWVPSHWAKEVVESHKELEHVPCYVVPEGVDPEIFKPRRFDEMPNEQEQGFINLFETLAKTGPDRFVAITVGKYEKRKGIDLILHTINKHVSGITPVCLIALIDDPFSPEFARGGGVNQLMSQHGFFPSDESPAPEIMVYDHIDVGSGHRVVFIPRILTTQQMVELYRLADLGVFPSLAEGWNLPLMECLACGTRALTVNYSGPTEYLSKIYDPEKEPRDIFMIDEFKMETAKDNRWFRGDRGEWAIPSSEQFKELFLKALHEGKGIKNDCWKQIHEEFSWDKAADKTIEVMMEMGIQVEYRDSSIEAEVIEETKDGEEKADDSGESKSGKGSSGKRSGGKAKSTRKRSSKAKARKQKAGKSTSKKKTSKD